MRLLKCVNRPQILNLSTQRGRDGSMFLHGVKREPLSGIGKVVFTVGTYERPFKTVADTPHPNRGTQHKRKTEPGARGCALHLEFHGSGPRSGQGKNIPCVFVQPAEHISINMELPSVMSSTRVSTLEKLLKQRMLIRGKTVFEDGLLAFRQGKLETVPSVLPCVRLKFLFSRLTEKTGDKVNH